MMLALFLFMLTGVSFGVEAFPTGRCFERGCDASPWDLKIVNSEGVGNKMCFVFDGKDCDSDPRYACCERFKKSVIKVVFPTMPLCNRSVEYVTVNGVRKGGGVFFDNYGSRAELRVTSLNLVEGRIEGTEVCVFLRNECRSWGEFCRLSDVDRRCMFAVFDPLVHSCCPTCEMEVGDAPLVWRPPPVPKLPPPRMPKEPNAPPVWPDWPSEPDAPSWPDEPSTAAIDEDMKLDCSCSCKKV